MHRKKELFVLLLSSMFLASCSSVPLGTMLRFRNYTSDNLREIEPDNFRARVTHQDSIIIKSQKTVFSLVLIDEGKEQSFKFPLEVIKREEVKKGLFKRKRFARTTLKFADECVADLVRLQKNAGKIESKHKGMRLGVNCSFDSVDGKEFPEQLNLSIDLKLNGQQEFFTLINSAKIELNEDTSKEKS